MGRISRAVPLDQLRQPSTDVREHRPEEAVMSLAASMGDPDVGQLQDVLVHPVDPEETVDDGTDDELHELFAGGHPMRVVDGETRRLAAEKLGWATLNATILPSPPEDTVVAQLDANTERIEMSEFETVRALKDYYEETGATLEDVGDKTGYSKGYLSEIFGLLEAPDWLVDPWQHPEHPLETGHARSVNRMLSGDQIERYGDVGDLDDEAARVRMVEDCKLMIDVQAKHVHPVGEFRKQCKRKMKETRDQLQDDSSHVEKQAEGQTAKAEGEHTPAHTPDPDPCLICGGDRPNRRKFAVPVCHQDYGMLSEAEANGDPLLSQSAPSSSPEAEPPENHAESQEAAEALAAVADIDPKEAQAVVQKVQQDAAQRRQGGSDD